VALFERTGWTGAWKNGVYPHHHYHSGAHEVLGIAAGWVRVRLGGETGRTMELRAGDVVVIPAGVAHKNEGSEPGPPRGWRLSAWAEPRFASSWRQIAAVPLPAADPVHGTSGPLLTRWRTAERG